MATSSSSNAPLVDLEAGAQPANYGSLEGKGGLRRGEEHEEEATTTALQPQLPGWMQKAGFREPPGGWYGPFGFLRIVQGVFWLAAMLASVGLAYSLYEEQGHENALLALWLLPAAVIAAMAARSHEGLVEQTRAMSQKNQQYALMTQKLREELDGMDAVRQQLNDLGGMEGKQITQMEGMLGTMEYAATVSKIITVLRSFTDAEMQTAFYADSEGAVDKKLEGVDEIAPFVESIEDLLELMVQKLDLAKLKRILLKSGVLLSDVSLLNAVVTAEQEEEARALMALLYFVLDPTSRESQETAISLVSRHMKGEREFGTKAKVREEVLRLSALAQNGRVPKEQSKALSKAVLGKFRSESEEEALRPDDDA